MTEASRYKSFNEEEKCRGKWIWARRDENRHGGHRHFARADLPCNVKVPHDRDDSHTYRIYGKDLSQAMCSENWEMTRLRYVTECACLHMRLHHCTVWCGACDA